MRRDGFCLLPTLFSDAFMPLNQLFDMGKLSFLVGDLPTCCRRDWKINHYKILKTPSPKGYPV